MPTEESFSKKITIEKNRIIVESDNKTWLDFIKREILTKELSELNEEESKKSMTAMLDKFLDKCWQSRGMRAILKCLVYQYKGSVRDKVVLEAYNAAVGKPQGMAGAISGIMRNGKKFYLPKDWLIIQHNPLGRTYRVEEDIASFLEVAIRMRESLEN